MTTEIKKELIEPINDDNETDNSGQNDNVDVKQEEINNNAKPYKQENSNSLQNSEENNKDNDEYALNVKICCCQKCCKTCSEDIIYGLTFIGRLIMTLYSFQALFFLYNFILNFIFLLPGMLYYTDDIAVIILVIFIYVFFATLCSCILIIPTYELLLFSFIRYKNAFAHIESLKIVMNLLHDIKAENKINYKKSKIFFDFVFIAIEISYIIGIGLGFTSKTMKVKDIIRLIIFILIYSYYLFIFFGYLFIAADLKIQLIKKSLSNCNKIFFWTKYEEFINEIFKNKKIPNINLLCYAINPLLKESYIAIRNDNANDGDDCFNCIEKSCWCFLCRNLLCCSFCCGENTYFNFKNFIRPFAFLISFILAMIIMHNQKTDAYIYILVIVFFLISYFLSSMLSFPYMIRNIRVYFLFSTKEKFNPEYKLAHPVLLAIIRLITFLIIFLTSLGLIIVYIISDEKNSLNSISGYEFTPKQDISDKSKLKPNICFSSIHNMYIYLFLPFINDAYYYDNNPTVSPDFYSSFQIKGYKELFYDNELYNITPIGSLIESNDLNKVKMIQYDVIKNRKDGDTISFENEMTILAIKGTTNKKDIFLDLQLYLPSILLTFLSYFSLLSSQKETYSFRFLEYSLSLPYRLFSQYLIIDGYLRDLIEAYNKNKDKFKKNLIIVGHSLGGGLAKLLGRFLGKQAISLSGPGVNAFHSLWEYEGSSDDFEISAIDLIPDMDLVPRVEVSGGTTYRIICKEGPLKCHGSETSLCEVLIMCRNPNYEQYCKNMTGFDDDQIKEIEKSSEL